MVTDKIKKIGVLTSGGDSPGMNATIRAIVRTALKNNLEVYGIYDGYKGLVEGRFVKLEHKDVADMLEKGGTFLGTARLVEFKDVEVRKIAISNLHKYGIDALVCIGGDGTYTGALKLSEMGVPCIGVPGTIDNDISSTEYTIGFDTCLNTIVEAIDKLRDTCSSHHRCSVVEVMGRYCPDLAIRAAICCGAEVLITKPEDYNPEELIQSLNQAAKDGKKFAIVVVAEHTIDVNQIAKLLDTNTPFETRATVLGHIQRGGRPTAFDRVLGSRLGAYTVQLLLEDKTGVCVGVKGETLINMDIVEANKLPKKLSKELRQQAEDLK